MQYIVTGRNPLFIGSGFQTNNFHNLTLRTEYLVVIPFSSGQVFRRVLTTISQALRSSRNPLFIGSGFQTR